jgi:hypothetical protein
MKKSITFYLAMSLISLSILNTKCKNEGGGSSTKDTTTKTVYDTAFPIAIYLSPDSQQIKNEVVGRLIRTTSIFVGDTVLKKINSRTDSIYFAQGVLPLNDNNGKPILDSEGKPRVIDGFVIPVPTPLVWDTGILRDSAANRFKHLLKAKPILPPTP